MIKPFEKAALAKLSDVELCLLHREAYDALIQSDPFTPERRNALTALEFIEIEYGSRHAPSP